MCGRFTQLCSWQEVHRFLNLTGPALELRPRYNVAPGQDAAAVRADHGERRLSILRWGLIPAWSRTPNIAYRLINARAETAATKPAFRAAYRSRRCLIPADGFYEWARHGATRQPYLIGRKDGSTMAFAGLWEQWRVREGIKLPRSLAELAPGETLETCTILTTAANETVAPVHERMPVILPAESFDAWLGGGAVELGPCPAHEIVGRAVGTWVNKASNEGPEAMEKP